MSRLRCTRRQLAALLALTLALPGTAQQKGRPAAPPKRDALADAFDKLERDKGLAPTGQGEAKAVSLDGAFDQVERARARGMAASVVNAMDGLAGQIAAAIDEQERLAPRLAKLNTELVELMMSRDVQMEEYRSGLFCSGCNRTRSEILARHETFPHEGQKIVRPTPAQIRQKEAELQAPIDQRNEEAERLGKRIRIDRGTIDEGIEQLEFGLWLWQTAITFEKNLVLQDLAGRLERHREAKAEADRQGDRARAAQLRAKTPEERKHADAELKAGKEQARQIAARQEAERAWARQTLARNEQVRHSEQERLARALERGKLPTRIRLVATYSPSSIAASHRSLGGNFKLGRLKAQGATFSTEEEISLVSVDRFIARFRESNSGAAIEAELRKTRRSA